MIRIIAEGLYDTAHSVFEAHEIMKEKPDAVFLELPDKPFQQILDDYSNGKLNQEQLKKVLFAAIGAAEREVDHDLVTNFLEGEIEEEELEAIETEGREIHVMHAAKRVGARLYAMDMPLDEVEKIIFEEFAQEHIKNTREVINTQKLPDLLWELSDLFHYPFYILERIMRHPAILTTNPYKHDVSKCPVCRLGALWDRFIHKRILPIFDYMPLSCGLKKDMKIAYVIRDIDYHREMHMAAKIASVYRKLKAELGREPRLLAIVHLWNAVELERLLKGLE